MAKTIRSPAIATANWVARAGAASQFYGTQAAAATWKAAASSAQAETNYATGVQAAVAAKSRLAGVNASTDAQWQAGIANVGVARYSQGVAASAAKMSTSFGKLMPAMATIIAALPPRGVRGSATNITRATTFMQKLTTQRGQFKAYGVAKGS
jgi:hypothetical protein